MRKTSLATIGQIVLARDPQAYYAMLHTLAYAQAQKTRKPQPRPAK